LICRLEGHHLKERKTGNMKGSGSLGAVSGSSVGGGPGGPNGPGGPGATTGAGESRIYIISDRTYNSNLGGTASESLEMMTTASTTTQGGLSSRLTSSTIAASSSQLVPISYSDVIPEDMRGQLPGAIPEEDLEYGGGPIVIKQELASEAGSAISRTSVFSDYLPCGLTRFHFSLCFGIIGFIIFWTGLLLRIYLPKT